LQRTHAICRAFIITCYIFFSTIVLEYIFNRYTVKIMAKKDMLRKMFKRAMIKIA